MIARSRRIAPLLIALVVAIGLLTAPASPASPLTVRAASPDLTIVSDARYDVQPAQKRVRVTVTLHLTNHLTDTTTKRYYFDQAYLAVLPGASGFKLTGATGTPTVSVSKRSANATILRLILGSRLFSGKSATYTLRFDLVDSGGAATRDLRIGDSLASFPVWAFATDSTPGSTVTVVFPAGYETSVEAGQIPAPTTDTAGRSVYRAGPLATPLTFFAYLVADRPGAYTERSLATTVQAATVPLTIRAWSDDPGWSKRVGDLVKKALPALGDSIGLPWPRNDTLVVQEAVSRSTGGYAGLFDPTQGLVEVAYYADDEVVLHEAAHSWFNGSLLADRWANEAFASYYGVQAAKVLKIPVTGNELTPALRKSAIPLNAWGPVGKETSAVEDYAYAATLVLADAIAQRAGTDGLRLVWEDAAGRVGAYQPPELRGTGAAGYLGATGDSGGATGDSGGATGVGGGVTAAATGKPMLLETVDGPPDWRALLDLLEADTPATYDDLWRTWVARPEDLPLLTERAAARTEYAMVLAAAGAWDLPRAIRDAMRAWRFDAAGALLGQADQILTQRTAIQAAAAKAGLTMPSTLQDAFQDDDGFGDAFDEAAAESAAITHYQAAVDAQPAAPDLVTQIGLWGSTPEVSLASAQTAFAAGDLGTSVTAADTARSAWTTASDAGQGRLVSLGALLLAVLVAFVLLGLTIRGRRRRRHSQAVFAASMSRPISRAMAHPMEPSERWRLDAPPAAGPDAGPGAVIAGPGAGPAAGPGAVATPPGAVVGPDPDATQPYATLAATPEGPPSGAIPDERDTGAGSG